jgi:hypothetical protein
VEVAVEPPIGPAADLSALLADIGSLRTALETDLSLVAGALDEGAVEFALELVDSNISSVGRFEVDALVHLEATQGRRLDVDALAPQAVTHRFARNAGPRHLPSARVLVAGSALLGFALGTGPVQNTEQPVPAGNRTAVAGDTVLHMDRQAAPEQDVLAAGDGRSSEGALLLPPLSGEPHPLAEALMAPQGNAGPDTESVEGSVDRSRGPAVGEAAALLADVLGDTRILAKRVRTTVFVPAGRRTRSSESAALEQAVTPAPLPLPNSVSNPNRTLDPDRPPFLR